MASSTAQPVCSEALTGLYNFILDMVKPVVTEVSMVYKEINEIPEMKDEISNDPELAEAVERVKSSVKTTMVHVHSFIVKVYELVEYIEKEESFATRVVQEGNAEEFKDYLKEVLKKSEACQNDVHDLNKYIQESRERITHLKELVEKRRGNAGLATGTAVAGGVAAAGGAGATVGGILGLTGLVSALSGPLAVVVIPVGAAVAAVGGITAAVAGTRAANIGRNNGNYDLILKIIDELKKRLNVIEDNLIRVKEQLRLSIDNHLKGILCDEEQLARISKKSEAARRAIVHTIQKVTLQVGHLKEYLQPLANTVNLDQFIVEIQKVV